MHPAGPRDGPIRDQIREPSRRSSPGQKVRTGLAVPERMRPTTKRWFLALAAVCAITAAYLFFTTVCPAPARLERKSAQLPLPSTFLPDRLPEFQKILTDFLQQ